MSDEADNVVGFPRIDATTDSYDARVRRLLGLRLRRLRRDRRLSVAAVAENTGLTADSVRSLETGTDAIDLDDMKAVGHLYGADIRGCVEDARTQATEDELRENPG